MASRVVNHTDSECDRNESMVKRLSVLENTLARRVNIHTQTINILITSNGRIPIGNHNSVRKTVT